MAKQPREFAYPSREHPPHVTPHLLATAAPSKAKTNVRRTPPSALTTNTYEAPTAEAIGRG